MPAKVTNNTFKKQMIKQKKYLQHVKKKQLTFIMYNKLIKVNESYLIEKKSKG